VHVHADASVLEPAKASNRLSRTEPAGSAGLDVEAFEHDEHGNITGMPHLSSIRWNFADQLSATSRQVVTAGTPETTLYVYGADGQRVRKTTKRGDGTRKHERVYLGGLERYREFDASGMVVVLERETLHVMDGRRRVAMVESRTQGIDGSAASLTRYQYGNHLGSASLELDEDAQVVSYEEYAPYGSTSYQAVRAALTAPKRYRYSAKERDEETGLYFYGARYYAPWLGRWTAIDPIGLQTGVNLYWSFDDNPIRFVDPDGREPLPSNFIEFAPDVETGLNRMAQLGLQQSKEIGLAQHPKTGKLMLLQGTTNGTNFWQLTPLGHSHTGADKGVGPTTTDLDEFARKKVKEHWIFSEKDGWGRLRYDAKTKSFDFLRNVGNQAVRYTIFTNPKFNPKDTSPWGQMERWKTSVGDPQGATKVEPPLSKGGGPRVKAPGRSGGGGGGGTGTAGTGQTLVVGLLFLLDLALSYNTISSQTTTYGQVKETSFWGGRLFGAAIGVKYGAPFGPWGVAAGAVLGAVIGENAVKSFFASVEAGAALLATPTTEAVKVMKDPEVQRYIKKGIDRATGMDEMNNAMDKMYQSGGR
jgi:RHS repeat-associated protein